MWIKTHSVNTFIWKSRELPVGLTQTPGGKWSYGKIPYALRARVLEQVQDNSRLGSLHLIKRSDDP